MMTQLLHKLHNNNNLKNIIVIFNSCEEVGSVEYRDIMAKLAKKMDYALVYEDLGKNIEDDDNELFYKEFGLVVSRKGIFKREVKCIGPGGHSGVLTEKSQRKMQ